MGEIVGVTEPVKDWAERHGWLVRAMAYRGRNGCRDYDFYRGGWVVMMEFKAPGKPLRLQQHRERKRLLEHGVFVHVIDDPNKGIAVLRGYDER